MRPFYLLLLKEVKGGCAIDCSDFPLSIRAGAITFLVNHDLSDFFIDLSTEVNRAIALLFLIALRQ